eukprot:TRINITY_DN24741_c0_g1_i1.p1 TRINITY_DN24741_c0_g1~~TRINITY_DN24741_c0_g1_i1.p1  ORF type:complete len:702 (+),score=122.90 TRINITY_DN24741_c0_g1_i1:50-2107(+)
MPRIVNSNQELASEETETAVCRAATSPCVASDVVEVSEPSDFADKATRARTWAEPQVVERFTFIDISDPWAEEARRLLKRCLSDGDLPVDSSSPWVCVKASASQAATHGDAEHSVENGSVKKSSVSRDEPEAVTENETSVCAIPSCGSGEDESPKRRSSHATAYHSMLESASSATEVLHRARGRSEALEAAGAVTALYLAAKRCNARGPPADLAQSADCVALQTIVVQAIQQLRKSKSLVRLAWALGKLGVSEGEVATAVVLHAANVLPSMLKTLSVQELSNCLWGIARLATSACDSSPQAGPLSRDKQQHTTRSRTLIAARGLALVMTAESSERIADLSGQCLSNMLWAAVRLGLHGEIVNNFLRSSSNEIGSSRRDLGDFSAQSLANALWASAKVGRGGDFGAVERMCAFIIHESQKRLREFQPQELSMIAWGVAKVFGRGGGQQRRGIRRTDPSSNDCVEASIDQSVPLVDVEEFLGFLAAEAQLRLTEFSPQGISNVAWALATATALRRDCCRNFVIAAAGFALHRLADFPPQAISNLCWAVGKLGRGNDSGSGFARQRGHGGSVALFMAASAATATTRLAEFSWQDLAGVLVASGNFRNKSPEAKELAARVVPLVTKHCQDLSTQVMLNIALAASRLRLQAEVVQSMASAIGCSIAAKPHQLNDMDRRQWAEIQRHCSRG